MTLPEQIKVLSESLAALLDTAERVELSASAAAHVEESLERIHEKIVDLDYYLAGNG